MKWARNELLKASHKVISFDESLSFPKEALANFPQIRSLQEVNVSGDLHYEPREERVYVHLEIDGIMVVPCAITMEDVEYPFSCESDEVFSFLKEKGDDIHECKGDVVELLPVIFQLILMEVPLKCVKEGLKEYPKGDGWEVVKEEDYVKEAKDEIDPRLAKLREFKIDE